MAGARHAADLVARHHREAWNERAPFPEAEIEEEMTKRGKTLSFTADELEDLVELSYSDARAFALLTLIFETVVMSESLHMDYIVPISV